MTRPQRLWLGFGVPALIAGAGVLVAGATSSQGNTAVVFSALAAVAGWAFVASGLVTWSRRPENGTGRLLVALGFAWFLNGLWWSDNAVLYAIGATLGSVFLVILAHLLLTYPQGRTTRPIERVFLAVAYPTAVLASVLPMLFDADLDCDQCPDNALLVADRPRVESALDTAFSVIGLVVFLGVAVIIARRWRNATQAERRVLTPVYVTGGVALGLIGAAFGLQFLSDTVGSILWVGAFVAFLLLPLFLLGGLLRLRFARPGMQVLLGVPDDPAPEVAQEALRRALRDPTLLLSYWLAERGAYVDVAGDPFEPREDRGRMTTWIEYEGRPLAALEHDPSLRHDPERLEEVVGAARVMIEKNRGIYALRRAEARNRALLDAMPDLMFRISRDGTYLAVHGEPEALAAPVRELLGAKLEDVLPRWVAEPFMACVHRALDGGGVETVEYDLEIDGVLRDFEARMVPSGADEVMAIVRDFTDRRRLESELQARLAELEREQQFTRTVVETAPTVFLLVDPHGRIVRFNATAERLLGYTDGAGVRGRTFWDVFLAPEDVASAQGMLAQLSDGEVPPGRELQWVTKEGERLVVSTRAVRTHDGRGRLRYLISGLDVTERTRQEEELRRSRARIVEAGDAERRRLERNLHDGAQQRLVALSLALRLATAKLGTNPEATGEILARASDELALALEDLRELARGIHPAILTDRGLAAALESLADRSPIPVELGAMPDRPLPPPVEAAAFYVVSESLANVVKYAAASSARVSVARLDGAAIVEVEDDGVGGADPSRGSGLRGLADRVEALDGRLEVSSPDGGGTRVRAEIPCA
jgi:PAS domain S-box-containing protein